MWVFLDGLIEENRQRFREDCPDVQYADVLEILDHWAKSDDSTRRQWAKLIRYRYVLGESQVRTQNDLGVSKEKYYVLQRRALEQLRREVLT